MPRGEKDERKRVNPDNEQNAPDDEEDQNTGHVPDDPEIAKDASPDDFE